MNDSRKDTLTLWGAGFLLAIGLSLGGCCSAQLLERELDDMAFSRSLSKERAYIIGACKAPNGFGYSVEQATEIIAAIDKRMVANDFSADQVYGKLNGMLPIGTETAVVSKFMADRCGIQPD